MNARPDSSSTYLPLLAAVVLWASAFVGIRAAGRFWGILGEVPAPIAVLGGALCLVGVYIARKVPQAVKHS